MNSLKLSIITACFCSSLLPLTCSAEDLDLKITSDTIRRSFNHDTAQGENVDIMPVYEYLQVEYNSLSVPELHVHAYGWYRVDLGDLKFYEEDHTGELLYGYLEYAGENRNINARYGRQAVYNGPSNESFDGLRLSGDLFDTVNLGAYYGLPVGIDEGRTRGNDKIFGGRLSLKPTRIEMASSLSFSVNVGLSYQQVDRDGVEDKKLGGLDYFIDLPGKLPALVGESNYNFITDDWAEHFVETSFSIAALNIRPYLQQANLADYISSESVTEISAPFETYKLRADDALEVGSDITILSEAGNSYGAKVKYFDYSDSEETSLYFSGLGTYEFRDNIHGWFEAGRMQGDLDKHRYVSGDLGVEWILPVEFHPFTATGELNYLYYDEQIFETDDSLFIALGLGTNFFEDALDVKFNVSYASDPYYNSDIQTMLTLSYHYSALGDEDF